MKESAILEDLEKVAEKLQIKVSSVNMRKYSYGIKSGLCRVNGEHRIIIDKHLHLSEKIDVLIDALQTFDMDSESLDPVIRKLFEKKWGTERMPFVQPAEAL